MQYCALSSLTLKRGVAVRWSLRAVFVLEGVETRGGVLTVKTLHFKANDITRTQGHNAVKACAYRCGENLTDTKTGETHRYAGRKGVLRTGIFASDAAPDWLHDDNQKRVWQRFGQEIERVEDTHNKRATALLTIDWHAAAPRELSLAQNWKLACTVARLFTDRGLAVAVAFHETDASDGGKNPHFHFFVPQRKTDKDGFLKRHYEFTGNPNAIRQAHKQLRQEYYALVNAALSDAGIDGITYDPEKQEGKEPTRHKGKAATAIERKAKRERWAAMEAFLRPALVSLQETGETYQEGLGAGWWERRQDAAFWEEEETAPLLPPVPSSPPAPEPLPVPPVSVPAPAAPALSSWQDRAARSPPSIPSR